MKHIELALLVGLATACGPGAPAAAVEPGSISREWFVQEVRQPEPVFRRLLPALEGCWSGVEEYEHRLLCVRRTGEELFELEVHRLAGFPVPARFARSEARWDGAALVFEQPPEASLERLELVARGSELTLEAQASAGVRLTFRRCADPAFAAEQREFEQRSLEPRFAVEPRHVAPPETWPRNWFSPELGQLVVETSEPRELRFLDRQHRTLARWTGSALELERPLLLDEGAVRRLHPIQFGNRVRLLTDLALLRIHEGQSSESITFFTARPESLVRLLPVLEPEEIGNE